MICGALPVPVHGEKNVSRSNVGGVASFSCDDWYILHGEPELVCEENGQWSHEVPSCQESGTVKQRPLSLLYLYTGTWYYKIFQQGFVSISMTEVEKI